MSSTSASPGSSAVRHLCGLVRFAMVVAGAVVPGIAAAQAQAQAQASGEQGVLAGNRAAVVVVAGEVATPLRLDAGTLAAMPRVRVSADDHGTPGEWEGVPLIEILRRAGVPTGDALRGRNLQLYVRIGALDGYAVVYALAELDPKFRDDPVILADRRDGRPLSVHEGPFRVIAPGEKRAGRWVRQVGTITVLRAAPAP